MNEREFQDLLQTLIEDDSIECVDELEGASVATFEEGGILTRNKGLTISLADGSEFQITIVQSSASDADEEEDEDG